MLELTRFLQKLVGKSDAQLAYFGTHFQQDIWAVYQFNRRKIRSEGPSLLTKVCKWDAFAFFDFADRSTQSKKMKPHELWG